MANKKNEKEAEEKEVIVEETETKPIDEEEIDESKFALPMAPVVRIMKEELDQDKMIRRQVKEAMNQWLEKLCRKVAKKMNKSQYTVIEMPDFTTAIEPYEKIEEIEKEVQRITLYMEKIKQDCDSLKRDLEHKFRFSYSFETKTE